MTSSPDINHIIAALRTSWAKDTSYSPDEWTPANPARGQCKVSALVVQDYLGGELGRYRAVKDGVVEKHYFNVFDGGAIIDTTIGQYEGRGQFEQIPNNLKGHSTVRDKVLADEGTAVRYRLLAQRVKKFLDKF
jgi:hypothetical protein